MKKKLSKAFAETVICGILQEYEIFLKNQEERRSWLKT